MNEDLVHPGSSGSFRVEQYARCVMETIIGEDWRDTQLHYPVGQELCLILGVFDENSEMSISGFLTAIERLQLVHNRSEINAAGHGHATLCVPAPGTSITWPVPECGHVDPANRASQPVFICVVCGYQAHADINAAIIIRERGIKLALAGGTPVAALRGNNSGPDLSGAEPEHQGRRGSGNQETGRITVREVA